MDITQADIDGLAEKLAGLDLTDGEAAALDVATRHAAAGAGDDVEGFYTEVEWTVVGKRPAATDFKARLNPIRGFSFGVERE